MANETRNPRAYELMSVLVPDLSDDDTAAAIERLSGYITAVGGEISETITESPWGRRRLAYTIRFNGQDYRDGIYVLSHFSATPNSITEIERDLKLDTAVMRYLIVMDDPKAGEKNKQDDQGQEAEASDAPSEQADASAAAVTEQVAPEAPVDAAVAEAPKAAASKLPSEGEGELWVAGDGTSEVPDGFPIKGNASSKIYHPEASPSYRNTIAELYFPTPEAAEELGYRLPKTMQAAGAAAGSVVEQAAEAAAVMAGEENPAPADAATDKED